MNPLHRKMFRQPGMSRQPAGILASSPELSNVVRQRMGQPVQMANGGQTVTNYMSAIRDLAAKGDKATLNNIATDQRLPRSVQMAAANALAGRSGVPDQIQAAPVSDADRMAANRANLGALRGRVGQDALTDQAMAQINAANRPSMPPPGPRPDVASRAQDMAAIASQDRTESTPLVNNPPSSSTLDQLQRAFSYPGEVIGMRVPDDAPGKPNPIGQGIRSFFFGTDETQSPVQSALRSADDAVAGATGAIDSGLRRVESGIVDAFTPRPTDSAIAKAQAEGMSRRGDFPDRPSGDLPEVATAEELTAQRLTNIDPKVPPEGPPTVVLSPPVVEKITQDGEGTQDGDENIIPPTGQNLSDAAKDLLNRPSLSAEAVNKQVDKLLGIDSAIQEKTGKPATKKERVKAEIAILKEALGEDAAKDIRTSGAYNLMMTGLMIAAGDSPDAMTNIVKGLAGGLKTYGDATGEEAQRKNKLEQSLGLQAYSNVREEIAAEKIAAVKLKEQKASLAGQIYLNEANNTSAMERLVAKEGFDAGRFQKTLKLQTDQLEQQLKIANMPPADIRTLTMIQQQPQLLEIMEQAAVAKDPTKLERDILGHLLKSPYFAMELAEDGGQQKLAGYATTLANSFRTARQQGDSEAGTDAKPPLTGAAAQAHIDANAAAKKAGQSTYTINGQPHKVK